MAMSDTMKATAEPTPRIANSEATKVPPPTKYFTRRSSDAPNMTGIARKNVNSAATGRAQPRARPPMIVEPEREVPGTSESTWKRPMPIAVFHERSSRVCVVARASAPACADALAK